MHRKRLMIRRIDGHRPPLQTSLLREPQADTPAATAQHRGPPAFADSYGVPGRAAVTVGYRRHSESVREQAAATTTIIEIHAS